MARVVNLLAVATLVASVALVLGCSSETDDRQLTSYEVPTEAMKPTIEPGSVITVDQAAYAGGELPERGDIIVFRPSPAAVRTCGDPSEELPFVFRVIGLPGEQVEARDRQTYVDGEEYVVEDARPPDYERRWEPVPAGQLLVLGDNRPGSCDAHQWSPDPFVQAESIIGEVIEVE